MNVREIFQPIFGEQIQEPTELHLNREHKRLVEMLAADDVTDQERVLVWEDLKGVLKALREKRSKSMGRCLNCAAYGQLKNALCVSCRI